MSIVRTQPMGFTVGEIAEACRKDARLGMRLVSDRHADRVIACCDDMLLRRETGLHCQWSRRRIRREIAAEYRVGFDPFTWLLISAVVNWIIKWYLDLIFSQPTFAPWAATRRGTES